VPVPNLSHWENNWTSTTCPSRTSRLAQVVLVPVGQAQPVPVRKAYWNRLCLSQWDKQAGCTKPVPLRLGEVKRELSLCHSTSHIPTMETFPCTMPKLYTTMELVPVPLVPTCATKWVYKAVENFQIFQFKGLSTCPISKFVEKDILKFVGNLRRAPSMVDQRWRTARDQRLVQRRMLHNIIQAHAYADLRYT